MPDRVLTCEYLGVPDSFCGLVHASIEAAAQCWVRQREAQRGFLGGWRTVEVRRGFYRQRWPEGQETPHA